MILQNINSPLPNGVIFWVRLQFSNMAANVCRLVDELPNSINKYDTLQKIHILVSEIHPRNLTDVVANVSFNIIFECLASTDDR